MSIKKITICDYGVGNLLSVQRALASCGAEVLRTANPKLILDSEAIVLPGVGAFGHCVHELKSHGLWEIIPKFLQTGKKILGICVGMQLCFQESTEFGNHQGFGFVDGKVNKIPDGDYKIPFIGWAKLELKNENNQLFHGINNEKFVYFVHSFFGQYNENCQAFYQLGATKITALIEKENLTACQFHPEKSGEVGLQILRNWINK